MTEATPFNFIGTVEFDVFGNLQTTPENILLGGFPFIPPEVDVSGFGYWSTLGGYNKDDATGGTEPTDAQIFLSLQNAGLLYWNLFAVNGTVIVGGSTSDESVNVTNDFVSGKEEPDGRQLKDGSESFGMSMNFLGSANGTSFSSDIYGSKGGIVRMYNGSTFVGYGLESETANPLNTATPKGIQYVFSGPPPDLIVYIGSYFDDPGFVGTLDVAYTELPISGGGVIPVMCVAYADTGGGGQEFPDAENLTSTAGNPVVEQAKINSIELYTYP